MRISDAELRHMAKHWPQELSGRMASELLAAREVIKAAKLFSANAAPHILECAREDWGNTNVASAINTRAMFEETMCAYLATYGEAPKES